MTVFISTYAYINKHDEVMDYVKYLTSSKVNSKFVSRARYISAIKTYSTVQKNGPLITECNILALNTAEYTLSPSNVTDRFIWGHAIAGRLPEMLTGNSAPEEITAEAERLAELCVKEGE